MHHVLDAVRHRVSEYAKKNSEEDFAECMKVFVMNPDDFKKRFPNRYAFLERLAKDLSSD